MELMSSKLYLWWVFALALSALSGHSALGAEGVEGAGAGAGLRGAARLLPRAAPALLRHPAWRDCTLQVYITLRLLCYPLKEYQPQKASRP